MGACGPVVRLQPKEQQEHKRRWPHEKHLPTAEADPTSSGLSTEWQRHSCLAQVLYSIVCFNDCVAVKLYLVIVYLR